MNTTFQHQIFSVKKSFCLLILWVGMLFCSSGLAQVYPVQVSTQLIPPYSLKLSDYVTTHSDKLIANILMTDINEYNRQLRFRLTIKGNGLHIRSNDFIIGANPVFIDGGLPLRLTNIDLRPYFELQNLQGITPQQYKNPLPDGNYQFCIEVFDWVSGQRLSNPQLGCSNAYLIVNDPPFLNLPRNGDLVEFKNPQNIIFNWTPRHLNATNVQYEFELRELWDTQIDPRAAFSASPNLYQTTTRNNTLLYGPGQTPLLENKTYGWRVRALVSDGISETSVFRNNGYSEIYYFTYAAGCSPPEFILAKSLSSNSEEITWQPNVDYKAYKVQYKKKGVRGAVWFDTNTTNAHARIYNLEPGTTYEFRVGGQCMLPIANQEPRYTFSSLQEFTTPTKEEDSYYNCGIAPEIRIKNKNPLPNLAINEVFTAGDFPVTVKGIEGQDGIFSGIGYIVVPYLADTKIAVEFNNIRINTDYQLYAGTLYTTYDPDWGNVDDISDELEAIGEIPEAIGELADLISKLFKKREKELKNLRQLQGDLTNGTITQEEFDEGAEQIGINVKAIDEQINSSAKEGVINSPYATDEQKEAIKKLKPTALADNNDLSKTNVDGITKKDEATNTQIQEISKEVAEQEQKAKDYLFSILMAMKSMDGDAFLKCKQCDKEKDGSSVIDGKAVYTIAKLGGKSLKCILGVITDNGTINFERLIQETSTDEQKQTFKKEFAILTDLIEVDKKEQFLVVSTKNNNIQECTTPLTFPNSYCEKAITDEVSEEEKGYLAEELQNCLQTAPNEAIANTVVFTSNEAINYTALKQQLQKQLDNAFFAEVKLAVNLKRNGAIETLRSSGLANVNSADITLNIQVNEAAQTVSIGTLVSENYLNEYVSELQQEANRRGIDVDVEELRKQVLLDLQEKETIGWFANLTQNTKVLFNDKIGGFVEVLQSSQKIVKNVWEEGTINASTWHSIDPDYTQWPEYAQFHPLLGGGTDGVIDEIVGIPMAIKGVYGVMTDAEQREALKSMFTGEGFSQLIDGIAKEAQDTYNDNDKLQHFGAQTTVSVASSITGVGIFTKGGKLAGTLQQLTDKIGNLTDYPKLTRFLDNVKKQDWYDEAFKTFQKQFDELIAQIPISPNALDNMASHTSIENFKKLIQKLYKLKDVDGIEKVIQDLGAEFYPKFKGAKFVVDYVTDRGDTFIKQIKRFESPVELDLGDGVTKLRKYDAELFDGTKLEFKDWTAWKHWSNDSFKKQFIPDLADGDFTKLGQKKYIFKGNDNITKSSLKENVLKSLKKAGGSPIDELDDMFDDINKVNKFKKIFGNEVNSPNDILKKLNDDNVFDEFFEIAE